MPKPTVTAGNATVSRGMSRAASGLFSVLDADGDTVTRYELWDAGRGTGSGYFSLGGIAQAADAAIAVSAAQLDQLRFVGGALGGAETLWVRAEAGGEFSDWVAWSMTTTGAAPVVNATSRGVHRNQSLAASTLFSASDADGDAIVSYQVWDGGTAGGSGYFALDGVRQAADSAITVSAEQLTLLTYVGGLLEGFEPLWVRAADAGGYGEWAAWTMTTGNSAPSIAAANRLVLLDHYWPSSDLFTATDAEGDRITEYEVWDSGTAASSGYFEIGGVRQASGQAVALPAPALGQLRYLAGSDLGAETLWVRAYDSVVWSPWVSWQVETVATLPPGSGSGSYSVVFTTTFPTLSISIEGNHAPVVVAVPATVVDRHSIPASSLFSASDADGDPITKYEFSSPESRFALAGIPQNTVNLVVDADQLGTLTYTAPRTSSGTDSVSVRAFDGKDWGSWTSVPITVTANHAPEVDVQVSTTSRSRAVPLGALVSATDAEGDAIAAYEFFDPGGVGRSGHYTIDGITQVLGEVVHVDATAFARFAYVSAADLGSERQWVRAYDGYDWSPWQAFTITTRSQAPTVTASNASVVRNAQALASGLFSVSDTDGDAMASYEFWDSGAATGSGHFTLNGVAQAANTSIAVSAANLANTRYVGGTGPGSETIWVRVNDGIDWSTWVSWTMTTTGSAPAVSASSRGVHTGLSVLASTLFSVSDLDSDPISAYEFWDSGTGANSGRFTILGVPQAQNASIVVPAANIAQVSYQGGSVNGAEIVWVRASDATGYGDWVSWTMTTGNTAPVVSAPNTTLAKNQSVFASTLFSVSDAESDFISQYEFWDDGLGANSGRFRLSGTPLGQNVSIPVAAANLANLTFATGSATGPEKLWLRAFDGFDWSPWSGFTLTTANQAPTVAATDADVAWGQSTSVAPMLAPADADADAITAYEFWDDGLGANSGFFTLSGIKQATNAAIPVTAAQLANLHFVGGYTAGAEKVWVRVNDGSAWSPWTPWFITTTGNAPIVSAADKELGLEEVVAASGLFSVSDGDGDSITRYEFWDDGGGLMSGHFAIDSVAQAANASILVNAADLSRVTYVAGEAPGTERVWVRADTGDGWGPWKSWIMSTLVHTAEFVGTRTDEAIIASQPRTVYYGRQGSDTFNGRDNVDDIAMIGGLGNDAYVVGGGKAETWVLEDGGSALDSISIGWWANPGTSLAFTVDSRHLVLGDTRAESFVFIWDWTRPENIIEHWQIAPTPTLSFSEVYAGLTQDGLLPDFSWSALGIDANEINSIIDRYNARNSALQANGAPTLSVAPVARVLGPREWLRLSDVVAYSDPDGDALAIIEIEDMPSGTGSELGYLVEHIVPLGPNQLLTLRASDGDVMSLANIYYANNSRDGSDQVRVRVSDGEHWSPWAEFSVTGSGNWAPIIGALEFTLTVPTTRPVSSLLLTSDANGDSIVRYEFIDTTDTDRSGYLTLDGNRLTANQIHSLDSAAYARLLYTAEYDVRDTIRVRAFDAKTWGAWYDWSPRVYDPNLGPLVAMADTYVGVGESVPITAVFTAADPDGDFILRFRFGVPDYLEKAHGGYLTLDGNPVPVGDQVEVAASDLHRVRFVGGALEYGTPIEISVTDGRIWSFWVQTLGPRGWSFGGQGSIEHGITGNRRPAISAPPRMLIPGNDYAARDLFSVIDPDGDPILLRIYDDDARFYTGEDFSGHFEINGVRAAPTFEIAMHDLDQLVYVNAMGYNDSIVITAIDPSGAETTATLGIATIPNPENEFPSVRSATVHVTPGSSATLDALIDVSDHEGNPITGVFVKYVDRRAGGGIIEWSGTRLDSFLGRSVSSLSTVRFFAGTSAGVDTIEVRARDYGHGVNAWSVPARIYVVTGAGAPDLAGNSPLAARSITLDATAVEVTDYLGGGDADDYYAFTLDEGASVQLDLWGMSENLDLQLTDNAGQIVGFSSHLTESREQIAAALSPGEYFVRVLPVGDARSYYSLGIGIA